MTLPDTPIERAARAIWNKLQEVATEQYAGEPAPTWEDVGEEARGPFRLFARAALEAIREPTEAMVLAACEEARREQVRPVAILRADAHVIFGTMIDAALEEQP